MSEITIIANYEYNGERTDTTEFYEKHGFAIIPNAGETAADSTTPNCTITRTWRA